MKFKELFINTISKTTLFEMAFYKKVAEDKIRNEVTPLIGHLIKISKWDDNKNYNKHKKDINSMWLKNIVIVKIKKDKFTKKDYFNLLYEEPIGDDIDVINKIIEWGLKDYHNLTVIKPIKK